MDFRVLGPLGVFDGESAVLLGGPQKRTVLAVLVIDSNTVVSADRIIDEVWGEKPPISARRTLHAYIANLRSELNIHGEILRGHNGGYILDIDPGSVDSTRFSLRVENARSLSATDPSAALEMLDEVLAMWRGPPFGSLAHDAPSLLVEATRLEEMRLAAVELRIDCVIEIGREDMVIGDLERLVAQHPYREGLWRRLMLALYRSGRQSEALRAYQRARTILCEQLGIEPSRDLTDLENQILLQDPALEALSVTAPAADNVPGPVGARDDRTMPPPAFLTEEDDPTDSVDSVFVAREDELAQLDRFLDDALNRTGRPIFVTGEAGTGKTALLSEFVKRAQASHPNLVVASGTCEALTGAGDPYLPFRQTMAMLTGDCENSWTAGVITRDHALRLWDVLSATVKALCDDGPALVDTFVPSRELAERLRAHGPDAEKSLACIEQLVAARAGAGMERVAEQHRILAEYAAILETLSERNPLMVIIDDLHWADVSSIQLFSYLAQRLEGRRILLVGTYRPEDVAHGRSGHAHPMTAVITDVKRRQGNVTLDLDGLDPPERRAFVDALVDAEPNRLDESFRDQLMERSEGLALFTVELLHHLQARGDLEKDGHDRWVQSSRISWQALPTRVKGVVERLIARLDPELRDALLTASVEGIEFTAEVVATVQDIDAGSLIHRLSLEAGHEHRLVEARGAHRTGARRLSRYRFRHSLFQTFLYESLDPVERAYHHEAVGNALEALHTPDIDDISSQLAEHFHRAGVDDKACRYLRKAGERSVRLSAIAEAVGYYTEALHLLENQPDTPQRDREELKVLLDFALPLQMMHGYWSPEARAVFERARVLGGDLDAIPELFAALRGLWHGHHSRLEFEEAGTLADRMLVVANQDGCRHALVVQAHRVQGESAYFRGDFALSRDHLAQAIAGYDPVAHESLPFPGVLDPGIISRHVEAMALWILGYPDQALRNMAEALALARDHPRSTTFVIALGVAASLHISRGEGTLALRLAEEKITVASETGFEIQVGSGLFDKGEALALMGATEDGIELMRKGLQIYHGPFLARSLGVLAEAYRQAGRTREGLDAVDEALAMVARAGSYATEAEIWRVKGELELLTRNETEAADSFSVAIDTARRQGARSFELRASTSMAKLLLGQGNVRDAHELVRGIYDWFTEGFQTRDLVTARALLDRIEAAS